MPAGWSLPGTASISTIAPSQGTGATTWSARREGDTPPAAAQMSIRTCDQPSTV